MGNIYIERTDEIITLLGSSPELQPSGNIYVQRLDQIRDAIANQPGAGLERGTSFPVGPAAGDLFWRSDLGVLCEYDGVRWLGPRENLPCTIWNSGSPWSANSTSHLITINTSILFLSATITGLIGGNDASNYWNIAFDINGITRAATLTTSLSPSGTAFSLNYNTSTIFASCNLITTSLYKIGNPGSIRLNPMVSLRRVY